MRHKLTILGCGSSGGVPRLGNKWGACDPSNPKNSRRRCSVLIERYGPNGTTTALIDTSPDLREQLLGANVATLDGVLYTHDHADHTHGIDDLRAIAFNMRDRVVVHMDERVKDMMLTRFGYCFRTPKGSNYPPILDMRDITPPKPIEINGEGGLITAIPIELQHGDIPALSFRIGNMAYTPDVSAIPSTSLAMLESLDLWIVDALRRTPHPSHFSLDDALAHITKLAPKRSILTNLHIDMDYKTLCAELPHNIIPAYDGMTVEFD